MAVPIRSGSRGKVTEKAPWETFDKTIVSKDGFKVQVYGEKRRRKEAQAKLEPGVGRELVEGRADAFARPAFRQKRAL
jgi:hypothetical protein